MDEGPTRGTIRGLMQCLVRSYDLAVLDANTRLPFRFGQVTLREAVIVTARAVLETPHGRSAIGYSSDLCVPKWFEKDPAKSAEEDVRALLASAAAAGAVALDGGTRAATIFEHWRRAYSECVEAVEFRAPDRLVRGFGVALLERALLDAACRLGEVSFFEALEEDLFGFRPATLVPELAGFDLSQILPRSPRDRIAVRHTVGMLDPLRVTDIPAGERLADGLPQALEEDVERYGLRYFKIKICGDLAADRTRLLAIAGLLRSLGIQRPGITLDGNEQITDLAMLEELFATLEENEDGRALLANLLWIEQPLPRALSFDPGSTAALGRLGARVPFILDEADVGLEAFPLALARGYRGISMKNCKGVFRSFVHRGLCELHPGAFLAGEDLTNLGVLALGQDLATAAALDLAHVERNGHHYFHGLDHLPAAEARDAAIAHPDLYETRPDGTFLRIHGGHLELASLQRVGYGYDLPIRFEERRPLPRPTAP